jgi:hypothetical protein
MIHSKELMLALMKTQAKILNPTTMGKQTRIKRRKRREKRTRHLKRGNLGKRKKPRKKKSLS